MALFPFKFKKNTKSFLGIDIGTSGIRIVELSRQGNGLNLENYGEVKIFPFQRPPGAALSKGFLFLSNKDVAEAIKAALKESEIKTKDANFSLPDFATFFTIFDLPPMSQKELATAVSYEARSYIPLPLSEVTLDWQIIEKNDNNPEKPIKVIVTAVPNDVILQYQQIASLSELKIKVLEAEAFSLGRSLVKEDDVVVIVDIGARSTACSIFEKKILKMTHSFNLSGNELTETLKRSFHADFQTAENLKKEYGISGVSVKDKNVSEVIFPLVDSIIIEVKRVLDNFYQENNKKAQKIILAGNSVFMPGLKEYFAKELKKDIEIANPFDKINTPPILQELLQEMGPTFAIAVGLAMRDI